MNCIQIFNNPSFGKIRVTYNGEEIYFLATDVCKALDIGNPTQAVARLDQDEVTLISNEGHEVNAVTESGLYSLVLGSRKKEAKAFKRWITRDVLPSIRRHGIYAAQDTLEKMLADPETGIKLLTALKEERARRLELEAKAAEDAPKVLFHDAVALADDTILIRDLAKLLKQNGVPNMGGNRLYAWLRENGYLCKDGASYNLPTQRSMELGLFRIRESSRICNGEVVTDQTPCVTGKGQQYFIRKFLPEKAGAAK